jgi:hypothetical protein
MLGSDGTLNSLVHASVVSMTVDRSSTFVGPCLICCLCHRTHASVIRDFYSSVGVSVFVMPPVRLALSIKVFKNYSCSGSSLVHHTSVQNIQQQLRFFHWSMSCYYYDNPLVRVVNFALLQLHLPILRITRVCY